MKCLFKTSIFSLLLLISNTTTAMNPAPGWYAGIMLGGSYSPKIDYTFFNPSTGLVQAAILKYSGYGNIGGQVGYRFWENFRVEAELLVNSSPYQRLTIGTDVINSPKTSTGLRLRGSTNVGAFMINGLYDFFEPGCLTGFAPYVGAGFGYGHVINNLKFYFNNVIIPGSQNTEKVNGPVGQLILGAGYFLDDFTWFGLDLRYFTTRQINILDTRPPLPAVNERVQFASINLLFSGMFNCA